MAVQSVDKPPERLRVRRGREDIRLTVVLLEVLADRFDAVEVVDQGRRVDTLIQSPKPGRAFVVCYFTADSHEEMAEYRAMTIRFGDDPRHSEHLRESGR